MLKVNELNANLRNFIRNDRISQRSRRRKRERTEMNDTEKQYTKSEVEFLITL